MNPDFFEEYVPQIIANLRDTKGLIIDIRDNVGGEDESGRYTCRFFSQTHHIPI